MEENRYVLAGWLAIASVIIMVPEMIAGGLFDAKPEKFYFMLPIHIMLVTIEVAFGIYAFLRFRTMLKECYDFHKLDVLIILIICGTLVINGIGITGRILAGLDMKIVFLTALMIVSIPMAVVGIMFGIKLLQLNNSLYGLKKPIAYIYMAAAICFATLIFVPLGLILMMTFTVMMALVMIRGPEPEQQTEVEFV
ncbi:MAG: hypothetical protein P9L92_01825 [Candidatus Electryonea clarkiae]|nr:hypothetical protein [Candidatus Electryonea clarkiae]MDP8285997.1 hypothetical protein [Candidatus Electryonea clarkiae]